MYILSSAPSFNSLQAVCLQAVCAINRELDECVCYSELVHLSPALVTCIDQIPLTLELCHVQLLYIMYNNTFPLS